VVIWALWVRSAAVRKWERRGSGAGHRRAGGKGTGVWSEPEGSPVRTGQGSGRNRARRRSEGEVAPVRRGRGAGGKGSAGRSEPMARPVGRGGPDAPHRSDDRSEGERDPVGSGGAGGSDGRGSEGDSWNIPCRRFCRKPRRESIAPTTFLAVARYCLKSSGILSKIRPAGAAWRCNRWRRRCGSRARANRRGFRRSGGRAQGRCRCLRASW